MKKENKLVVGDEGWAKTIPEWLLDEVKGERMVYGLGSLVNPKCEKVGDAEVIVYLMTASLRAPISSEYTNIYLFLTAKLMKRRHKEIPDFLKESSKKGLSDYEKRELRDLRNMIYHKRGGEIDHPILNIMRAFKKDILKNQKIETLKEELRK